MNAAVENVPKVSVAIVNWNTRELLEACLASIFQQTSRCAVEVIVADNGSVDGSCEMVKEKFPQVRLFENRANLGFAKGTNQGFEHATGDYVLMLNSDTVILDGAIDKTVAFADEHPEAGAVGCRMIYPDGRFQNSCFRIPDLFGTTMECAYLAQVFQNSYLFNWSRYGCRDRIWTAPREVECVMGSFILLRNSVLREVGFLDEDFFMYGEETDLCRRIWNAGKKIYYYPGATIIHVHGGSQKSWADLAWSFSAARRGVLYFLSKWDKTTAWMCNLVIALTLLPRIPMWAALDLRDSVRSGKFEKRRVLRASALRFHAGAVVQPWIMREKWGKK